MLILNLDCVLIVKELNKGGNSMEKFKVFLLTVITITLLYIAFMVTDLVM